MDNMDAYLQEIMEADDFDEDGVYPVIRKDF